MCVVVVYVCVVTDMYRWRRCVCGVERVCVCRMVRIRYA